MRYENYQVWSVPLRLFHWIFSLAIVLLVVTGFYIADPWTGTMQEDTGAFPMQAMRNIHFIAAFFLTAVFLVRIWLLFFGNRHERLMDFAPFTKANIKNLWNMIACYLYLTDKKEKRKGHNALAGAAYLTLLLVTVFQVISGFYLLYPESGFWQGAGGLLFGTQQTARFVHHILMWIYILYTLFHLYTAIWSDIKYPGGIISAIFTGNKFAEVKPEEG